MGCRISTPGLTVHTLAPLNSARDKGKNTEGFKYVYVGHYQLFISYTVLTATPRSAQVMAETPIANVFNLPANTEHEV